jgi:tricorn protease
MRPLVSLLLISASLAAAQTGHLLLRNPALSKSQIVFTYAGDLWSVPREGGEAKRLTAGPGMETSAVFSPDGSTIAFTGEYDGNVDVFTIPAAGGVPKRLTYHPGADVAVGWTPDGKRILFRSHRAVPNDGNRLYTIPLEGGGLPEELPLPIAEEGSYSPDGTHIAYVPLFQWQEAWKRYRGGQTRKIWIANLEDSSIVPIPRENSNDFDPMWVGDRIYFLSDREGPVTLFYYDTHTKKVARAIENRGLDFKSATAGPGAILYEQFGSLHLYDLKSGRISDVQVTLAGDLPELRSHYVNVAKRLENADISPNGVRAVFEARGEIITVPAEKGDPRNLTQTTGVMEREPRWSPDGQSIAYLSDESGEYALHIRNQDGSGEAKKIPLGDKAFYSVPRWSPDNKKIAYLDNHNHLFYVDIEPKKPVLIENRLLLQRRWSGARMVARQPVAGLFEDPQESHAGDLSVFAGERQDYADYRRSERRREPRIRQGRQVPVFHGQHQLGRGDGTRYRRFFAAGHGDSVRGSAVQDGSFSVRARERRRKEEGRGQEGRAEEG